MKKDEEREVPDPWESIEEVLEVVLEVLEVFFRKEFDNPLGILTQLLGVFDFCIFVWGVRICVAFL